MWTVVLAIAAWSAQFGVVIAAASLALAGTRARSPRVRLAVWQATLVGALVVPFVASAVLPRVPFALDAGRLVLPVTGTAGLSRVTTLEASSAAILACLAAGLTARIGWVLVGWRRLLRWTRREAVRSPVFDEAAAELGVDARLVCGDQVASPFTFGWRAPVVVANTRLLADPSTARAVFLHELAHVARGDWAFVVAEEVVRAVLWFHPAAWWATAEMRVAREEIVDRSAASRLGSRRAYLEALLSVSPAGGPGSRLASALTHRRQLARRIRALAVEVPMSTRQVLFATLVVTIAVASAAYAAAGSFPVWSAAATSVAVAPEDVVEKPVPTRKVEAVYPPEAKEKHVEGEVELSVKIGADGLVKEATVKKSVPPLDEAALAAIRQWEFRAGRVNGKAVEVMTTITFEFRLK